MGFKVHDISQDEKAEILTTIPHGLSSVFSRRRDYLIRIKRLTVGQAYRQAAKETIEWDRQGRPTLLGEMPMELTDTSKEIRRAQPSETVDEWMEMAAKVRALKKKSASPNDQKEWASEHVLISLSEINPEDVPSVGALQLLKSWKENPTQYNRIFYPTTKATVQESRSGSNNTADGQDLEDVTDSFADEILGDG